MPSELRGWYLVLLLLFACTPAEPKAPILLGFASTRLPDPVGFAGEERISQLAVETINEQGGINGHMLELRIRDDEADPEVAAQRLLEFIDEGAVGMLGPSYSSSAEFIYPLARDHKFPIMSASATAPSLATVDDGGYMFRSVTSDTVQGLALAYYMTAAAQPAITQVTVVHEDSSYGTGLADAFQAAYVRAGGTIEARLSFPTRDPLMSEAAAEAVIDELEALPQKPSLILLIAIDDISAILNAWAERPAWSDVKWFFTEGVRYQYFLDIMPPGCAGMLGTAPTFPTLGDAYGELRRRYAAKHPDLSLDQEAYAPNIWDAVYLFAAALAAQEAAGEPFGGQGLRDRLTEVSKGPGLILHAGQWRDVVGTLQRGNKVDYDGASGPMDLDATGEPLGPYEVWKIIPRGTTYAFEQTLYIDAQQIELLRGP